MIDLKRAGAGKKLIEQIAAQQDKMQKSNSSPSTSKKAKPVISK